MKYDSSKHHRRSIRLKGYDYTQAGAYFFTLVAWQRECMFGEIVNGRMRLNSLGKIIQKEWKYLPYHFPGIRLGAFVVMPNHVHGIIIIDPAIAAHRASSVGANRPAPDDILASIYPLPDQAPACHDGSPQRARTDPFPDQTPACHNGSPQPSWPNGAPRGSLGAMISQFKSRATKRIWSLPGVDRHPIWQRNYYEHILRNDSNYQQIIQYI